MPLRPHLSSICTLTWLPPSYHELVRSLSSFSAPMLKATLREWLRRDLWFLLVAGLNRSDVMHPWLFARCQDIQRAPDGHLDLWARGHFKSSIQTFAKTVQDILASHGEDPLPEWGGLEPTFGIFSHSRPIAKAFLRQIKHEFERNALLKELFPDVLYERPESQSPSWSEDGGISVRRHSSAKEQTIEAWGLIDGQPTSKHFNVLLYDDIVVRESVTTPEQIKKTTEAWELSLNLGDASPRLRALGTRWHFNDTYRTILDRRALTPRIHPATTDGTAAGEPVLLTRAQLDAKIRDMGPYSAASQLFLNPTADSKQTFRREWLEHRFDPQTSNWRSMQRALLVDPAHAKKTTSDYTAMAVIGLGQDGNTYLLDALRDRLNLAERIAAAIRLHKRWQPHFTGWEKYGKDADIEALKAEQAAQTYRFEVIELGGRLSKIDRVNRLIPVAARGELWLPESLLRTNHEGKLEDLVAVLIEQELLPWPVPVHDDLADAIARRFDLPDLRHPRPDEAPPKQDRYRRARPATTWMSR